MEEKVNRLPFIQYYSTFLIPWYPGHYPAADTAGFGPAQKNLSTSSFIHLLNQYSHPEAPALHRARFHLYNFFAMDLNAPKKVRVGSQIWRARAADRWDSMDPAAVPAPPQTGGGNGGGDFNPNELSASVAIVNALDTAVNTSDQPNYMKTRNEYYEEIDARLFHTLPAVTKTSIGFSTERLVSGFDPVHSS